MTVNVAVAQDPAGNLKPAKDKSTERIDGVVALIMAMGRAPGRSHSPSTRSSLFDIPLLSVSQHPVWLSAIPVRVGVSGTGPITREHSDLGALRNM
jgi:hypothetical protein